VARRLQNCQAGGSKDPAKENVMRSAFATLGLTTTLLLAPGHVRAQAQDPDAYGDDYQTGNFGRVRYQENDPTILRANEDAKDDNVATVNTPIFPGDTIRTGPAGRAEIQLAGGTLVRVDRDSEITFQSLPDSRATYQDNSVLRLTSGAIQLTTHLRDKDKDEFRVDTASSSIYPLGDGEFRIETGDDGETRVLSRRGVAEVGGEHGSVLVRGGMRTVVSPVSAPNDPRPHNTFALSAFDRWCADREERLRAKATYARHRDRDDDDDYSVEDVPDEVRPYYRELSDNGRWVYVPTYGYSWYPYDMEPGWRPYNDGRWVYGPHGYFWVGNEPWGWAPYHYGRWNWVTGYGWCWSPGRVFAGAWVSWSWGSIHVGWSPLDFWGRPAFYGSIYYDYYDPGCWTFISYQHFGVRSYRTYAVPVSRIGVAVRENTVVVRPPRVAPRELVRVPAVRERALRQVREDRVAHVLPISRESTPSRRFKEVEDRLIQRGPRASVLRPGTGRDPGVVRSPGGVGNRRPVRGGGLESGPNMENPGSGPIGRRLVDRVEPGARTPAGSRDAGGRDDRRVVTPREDRPEPDTRRLTGFPRRTVRDTRIGSPERDGTRDGGRDANPGVDRSRPRGEASDRDRVRSMYERLSRPREARKPESAGPSEQNPRGAAPRNDPRPRPEGDRRTPPPRIEARGAPQRQGPPAMQPSRQAPPPPRREATKHKEEGQKKRG